ncbi:cell division protein FtsZ [Roseateles violae]|uniref:Cell division protein FtsZ n=1 Tax=Roseateles violae TaxID=3058042 RepID=A0ABT8DXK9_9BURK|nr:cell division protein FtsZ [Pelomonas sp. PFR6]MDN3922258.1 cell division protein FtsZ [Pelomonas sp. PFR6]
MAIEMIEEFDQGTQIKVIGVGGGGGNAVDHMIEQGVQGVEFICANTDAQALNRSKADQLLQLGSSGLGAGAKPEMGKAAAEEAEERIRESIAGAHMLFITAGMGGGTGTGAAPVIAKVAKEMGILTVGVVTKPFEFEGNRRSKAADAGLAELEANVDSLIVVLNDKLLDVLGDDVTQDQAFAHANDVLKNAVGGISDIIHIPGLVNVDFEDVKTVMSEPGKAMMGTAQASGPDRASKAAEAAVACPLLEGIDLSGARGVLVLIAANRNTFKLSESRNAMNAIKRYASEDAHIIYGTAYDESLGDALRVTVIATGLSSQRARQQAPLSVVHQTEVMRRTGTDNMPVLTQQVSVPGSSAAAGLAGLGHGAHGGDYGANPVPSVWRHGRTAAAKVEALSSNGMDEIEIPAFLRKQAD